MIAVVDYGVGNVFSLCSSLRFIGVECALTGNPKEIASADRIILPGVGAFGDAAAKLRSNGLDRIIVDAARSGRPLLGICLGMQLLFDTSEEYGEHHGLGLIHGEVKSLADALGGKAKSGEYKVPHIGWNGLVMLQDCPILKDISEDDCVYYVHSFYAPVGRRTAAGSQYGHVQVSGVVQRGNVFGTQFHPEKSGEVGLKILKAFAEFE